MEAFRVGSLDPSLVETMIILISKGKQPMHLRDFRPISLCNVIYKVITKVVVNRLRLDLQDIIGPLKNSFILRRCATDNMIVA